MAREEVKIIIVCNRKTSFVVPGHRHVKKGDSVQWRLVGPGKATLFFPVGDVFKNQDSPITETLHAKCRETDDFEVKQGDMGFIPYAVYCEIDGEREFAEGGSSPGLIVG